MPDSIDDVADEIPPGSESRQSVDDVVNETPLHDDAWYDQPRSIGGKIWDAVKYGAMIGGMFLGLAAFNLPAATMVASTYISSVGLTIGAIYDNKKKKLKNTWRRLYKEFAFGNIVGLADYAVFSLPEILLSVFPGFFGAGTLFSKIVKTLLFNPVTLVPYLFVYNSMKYVRDYVGLNPFKFVARLGNMCKKAVSTIKQETKDIFTYLSPLHFVQLNYLPNASLRLLQSAVINNPIFRYLTAKKEGPTYTANQQYKQKQATAPGQPAMGYT